MQKTTLTNFTEVVEYHQQQQQQQLKLRNLTLNEQDILIYIRTWHHFHS